MGVWCGAERRAHTPSDRCGSSLLAESPSWLAPHLRAGGREILPHLSWKQEKEEDIKLSSPPAGLFLPLSFPSPLPPALQVSVPRAEFLFEIGIS